MTDSFEKLNRIAAPFGEPLTNSKGKFRAPSDDQKSRIQKPMLQLSPEKEIT
jgi:hypothetical protein